VTDAASPLLRHAAATVHGRYLVMPREPSGAERWLVGFHGQAQSADEMLAPLSRTAPDHRWRVISVQALHPFYAKRATTIVAGWMTRQDRELAIADNVAYVDTVLDQLVAEFGAPRALVFAGFSQGAAMAYRAALLGRHAASAVVTCGGDVPPELLAGPGRTWPRVLAAAGRADAWYTPARLEADVAALRERGARAEALVFEGGHEWTDELAAAGARLLGELGGA
jgi:predicted esterase